MEFSDFDHSMFELARGVAESSDFESFHVGCVLTYKTHIVLSTASNSEKTHPMQKRYNRRYRNFHKSSNPIQDKAHAEMLALSLVPYTISLKLDWSNVRAYVFRICPGKRLGMGLARPCPSCMSALRDRGIRKVYYTTDDGYAYEEIS